MQKVLALVLAMATVVCAGNIHTTYHWHMQQPIYWPASANTNPPHYQAAWESLQMQSEQNGHPDNDLKSIFGKQDRVNAYQHSMTDAIQASLSSAPNMGAQSSFSGCLMENLNSLGGNFAYPSNWNDSYAGFVQSNPGHLDFVAFTYHHALGVLVDQTALAMEIALHKAIFPKTWGAGVPFSKGFFPAEMSFSERMIPTLVKAGIEWVLVPNNHVSRATKNYPYNAHGDNCNPPNRADQLNPAQQQWFNMSISRGVTTQNAVPFSYTPHWAKHVDPTDGKEYKIIVVPVAMGMSWQDGYECYGTQDIDSIASANNPQQPMLIVMGHDGDNAFGGGYSYYHQCVPQFAQSAAQKGYEPSTVQAYLDKYPPAESDVIHVEDGAWINKDGDFGSPRCVGWNTPLTKITNSSSAVGGDPLPFDIPGGWDCNERNWAVITAAQNWVETAEQVSGGVRVSMIQEPQAGVTNAELAWHFFLPSITSGYMYYGTVLDMPDKQSVAGNQAVEYAQKAVAEAAERGQSVDDKTPPNMWYVMRHPQNPGGVGMGFLWGWNPTVLPTDFYIYTFVFDVSGVHNVTAYVRQDDDGENPLNDNANEVYEPHRLGLTGVGAWKAMPMTRRAFPPYDEDNVKFQYPPKAIADEYYVHVTGFSNVLLDYYVQAVDTAGNVRKSDIFHVWVGDGKSG